MRVKGCVAAHTFLTSSFWSAGPCNIYILMQVFKMLFVRGDGVSDVTPFPRHVWSSCPCFVLPHASC